MTWNEIAEPRPGLAFRTHKLSPFGAGEPAGIVLHHTGAGILARAMEWGVTDDEAAIRVYQTMMEYSPHYVVGHDGIYQIVPEELKAWHAANPKAVKKIPNLYPWWARRWPGASSPVEVTPGRGSPNDCIGIELVAVPKNKGFSRSQYALLDKLLNDLCARYRWTRSPLHIVGHADVDPERRSTSIAPWDPPESTDWSKVWRVGVQIPLPFVRESRSCPRLC